MMNAFQQADTDRSGSLDAREIWSAVSGAGFQVTLLPIYLHHPIFILYHSISFYIILMKDMIRYNNVETTRLNKIGWNRDNSRDMRWICYEWTSR